MNNHTIEEITSRYIGSWNELTFETIKVSLAKCCIAEVTYTDRQTPLIGGIDLLANVILGSYKILPGRTIAILTPPEYFDSYGYYSWLLNVSDTIKPVGRDYFEYNDDNFITKVVAFLPVQ